MNNENVWIYSIIYIILIIIIIITLIKKNKEFAPGYKGFIFGILIYYAIIPLLTILNIDELNSIELSKGKYCSYTISRFIINADNNKLLFSILMVAITLIFFNMFYKLRKKNDEFMEHDLIRTSKLIQILMWFTLTIGSICLLIFFSAFGGIKSALSYAEYARSFENSLIELAQGKAIFIIPARLITVTPFLALYLMYNTKKQDKKMYKIVLVLSFILSIIYFLFNAGRTTLIAFIVCYVYMIISKKIKRPWILIIIVAIISLPLIDILDSLFVFFKEGDFVKKDSNYLNYIYQLNYPYKNTLILQEMVENYGLRHGKDFITGIMNFLPGISFEASYVNTSLFIRGIQWKSLGGIPNDFITFSYLQFSIFGVILISSILGYVFKRIDTKLIKFPENPSKKIFEAIITMYTFLLIGSADFENILKGFILIIISLIIINSTKRKEKK